MEILSFVGIFCRACQKYTGKHKEQISECCCTIHATAADMPTTASTSCCHHHRRSHLPLSASPPPVIAIVAALCCTLCCPSLLSLPITIVTTTTNPTHVKVSQKKGRKAGLMECVIQRIINVEEHQLTHQMLMVLGCWRRLLPSLTYP